MQPSRTVSRQPTKFCLDLVFDGIVLYLYIHIACQSEVLLLTHLGSAGAVVLQSNCVRRTCSRSLHSNCIGRGLNPSSPRHRPSALTDRRMCRTIYCICIFIAFYQRTLVAASICTFIFQSALVSFGLPFDIYELCTVITEHEIVVIGDQ